MPTSPLPILFCTGLSRTKQAYYAQGAMIHYIRLDININMDWTYPRGIF